ncbi:MAG: GNAT family N-acetyltransferase [Propionivibrio sp.]
MGWETFDARSGFPAHARDWDRLVATLCRNHPFFDSRFIGALLEHFSTGGERLCLYRKDGVITAALILQPKGLGRWTSFRPSQAQVTAVLIDDALILKELFRSLPRFAWTIELFAVDPRFSPNFLREDMANIVSAQAYTIGVDSNTVFADYWNRRPKNLKANIRRYQNRLEKEFGSSHLTRITGPENMKACVARYGALESAGWKGAAGSAIAIDNKQGDFYSDVMHRFASSGQAVVYELHVPDRLAASRLMLVNENMSVILKTTYEETLAHIAPGRIQLYQLICERLTDHPEQTIEFYTNATRDQKEWATFGCAIQNIDVFRGELSTNLYTLLKSLQNRLRKTTAEQHGEKKTDSFEIGAATDLESLATAGCNVDEYAAKDMIDLSVDWFELLRQNVYQNDAGVRYYYVVENNRLSSILPLRLTKEGNARTIEALNNYYTSLYAPLNAHHGNNLALHQILETASMDHGNAHIMRFAPMDPDSPAYSELLNELRKAGWVPFKYFCFGNWYLNVTDNWEGYLRKRSANLRSTIKRRTKEFCAAGGTLKIVNGHDDPEHIAQAILDFQEVYAASWKVPEPHPDFVPALVRLLACKNMLRLGVAKLGDKPIAAQIWIATQNKASIFKLAYHQAYAAYSPGTVLTSHLLRHVIEIDNVKEVDYLIGDDKYKQHWMTDRRERWGIIAFNPRTLTGLRCLLVESMRRLVKASWQIMRKSNGNAETTTRLPKIALSGHGRLASTMTDGNPGADR